MSLTKLYTIPEAAEYLRLSYDSVWELVRAGELQSVQLKPNGKHMIPEWAINKLLRQKLRGPAKPKKERKAKAKAQPIDWSQHVYK